MRVLLAILLLYVNLWALPAGYIEVRVDENGTEAYLDDEVLTVGGEGVVVEATPGKHFVSLFPPRKVYLAFRDDAPEHFWDRLRTNADLGSEYQLISSYERGAVREGTEWVYVVPDDTIQVQLSRAAVDKTYNRDSSCVLRTFLAWTILVGVGMIVSVFLAKLD